MIDLIKNKIKVFNLNNGNFLNIAPYLINIEQIKFLKKKKLNKLLELNLFYRNEKFNNYFWSQIISFLNNININEDLFFKNIKKNFSDKNTLELISIYQTLLLIGKFKLAFKIRNLFFKKISSKKVCLKSNYLEKLKRINNLLQNFNLKKNNKNKIKIRNYLYLKNKNQMDIDYDNYIKNKNINLIGVGIGIVNKKNIKNFQNADLIVRMNYHSKKQIKNFYKCDVSYYSNNFLQKKKIIEKNLNLQFMLIKKKWKIGKFRNYKVRQFKVFDDLVFGTPSLLVGSVLDLLAKQPKSIKIFNSTVYYPIGSKIYDNTQKKAYGEKTKSNIIGGFGVHDIISEFLILRNLFNLEIIKADNNLKYVLTLDINKFLNDMENFYKPLVFDFYKNSN